MTNKSSWSGVEGCLIAGTISGRMRTSTRPGILSSDSPIDGACTYSNVRHGSGYCKGESERAGRSGTKKAPICGETLGPASGLCMTKCRDMHPTILSVRLGETLSDAV